MADLKTIEVPIQGMDCAECTQHVQRAISKLDGVQSVNVLLATEKAVRGSHYTPMNGADEKPPRF